MRRRTNFKTDSLAMTLVLFASCIACKTISKDASETLASAPAAANSPVNTTPEFEDFAFNYDGMTEGTITSKLETTPVILDKCTRTGSNQHASKITCTQQTKKRGKRGYTIVVSYPINKQGIIPIPEGKATLDNGLTQNLDCLFVQTVKGLQIECKSPHIPVVAPVNPGNKTNAKCSLVVTGKKMIELNDECVDYVVAAMQRAKKAYYETGTAYYDQTKKYLERERKKGLTLSAVPPLREINECVLAAPDRWSDLQAHYYALFPGYAENFFPNVRECFTSFARFVPIGGKRATYPEIYEYCVHQPIDQENGYHFNWTTNNSLKVNAPAFDKTKRYQGPLAWTDKDQGDVFKFVMFGGPCTIHPVTQQKILNKFYGVTNPSDTQECLNKRKIVSQFERDDGTQCSLDARKQPRKGGNQFQLAESCVDQNGDWIK